jgi:hypothetical protein
LLRKLSLQSGLSYGSAGNATKVLKFHPNHAHVIYKLEEPDKDEFNTADGLHTLFEGI